MRLKLLGTGAGPGTPAFHCQCVACQEARENPQLSRTRSGALIDTGMGNFLIDASPDLRSQLIRDRIESLEYVLITHWHYDHFGGLGEMEYYVKLVRHKPLPIFLPPEALNDFQAAYPNLHEVMEVNTWDFGERYEIGDLSFTPLPATHGVQTAGLLLEGKRKIAYFTDTSSLKAETADRLKKVDAFVCDATFNGDNWFPDSHMSITEAVDEGQRIGAVKTVLTHLSMHYSIAATLDQINERLKKFPDVSLAYDGMEFEL